MYATYRNMKFSMASWYQTPFAQVFTFANLSVFWWFCAQKNLEFDTNVEPDAATATGRNLEII